MSPSVPSDTARFIVEKPIFDGETGEIRLPYTLGDHRFVEKLAFPTNAAPLAPIDREVFARLLDLTAAILGTSYYKLLAPRQIDLTSLSLSKDDHALLLDVYENGLGEFFARNAINRYGQIDIALSDTPEKPGGKHGSGRKLVLIGGGKDSLVSVELLRQAGDDLSLFAVNPKGPIVTTAERSGFPLIGVRRTLDPEMLRLSKEPGFFNGHVPSTAINTMIASLAAQLFGFSDIILSNERSASEGNIEINGRSVNHQHSKSLDFEVLLGSAIARKSGGGIRAYSLLRPFSEARIACLFARETRYDDVFSSCNENFKLGGNSGPLWCGKCPKCHFVFLILAPFMQRSRLEGIFGQNVLDNPNNIPAYRELTGLAGHKPWECVGEILEAAACLHRLAEEPDWQDAAVVKTLNAELVDFYGPGKLASAFDDLMALDSRHHIPPDVTAGLQAYFT